MTEITGLLFHTNSNETYYIFTYYNDVDMLELEISQCTGINEGGCDYQFDSENNRHVIGYVCDTLENIKKDPILHKLYIYSRIVSIPSPDTLKTKIIWKGLRITKQYLEFPIQIWGGTMEPVYDISFQYIGQVRLQRLDKVINESIEQEIKQLSKDIEEIERDVKHQTLINAFKEINDDKIFTEDILECIEKYI